MENNKDKQQLPEFERDNINLVSEIPLSLSLLSLPPQFSISLPSVSLSVLCFCSGSVLA
jgi:hypothetical protein